MLTLRAERVNILKWWVDASYDIHHDMRGETGVTMSMGKNGRGYIISMSKKQKLNTKSSTEVKLIGANGVLPHLLWTRCCIKAQGYTIGENIMYQDNMSAILLDNNRRKSITKNTEHL